MYLQLLQFLQMLICFFEAEEDSVFLGSGYVNDIYYSFENGEIHSVDRKNWDIGFYANILSAGIITNDGNGVELLYLSKW